MRPASNTRGSILSFINEFQLEHGYAPSVREIAAELRLGLSTVQYHLDALKGAGYISRRDRASRSIQVIGQDNPLSNLDKLFTAVIQARRDPEQMDVLTDVMVALQDGRVLSKEEWRLCLERTDESDMAEEE